MRKVVAGLFMTLPQEIETPLFKNDQDRDRDPHLSAAPAIGA
jgi:hypothetical protein